ncbi:MAG: addiction module protein [Candidatus Binatia bacterium]
MSNLLDEMQAKASLLSPDERAILALHLIESLDAEKPTTAKDWERTWVAECERRLARYESGEDQGVPLDEALERARSQLKCSPSASAAPVNSIANFQRLSIFRSNRVVPTSSPPRYARRTRSSPSRRDSACRSSPAA